MINNEFDEGETILNKTSGYSLFFFYKKKHFSPYRQGLLYGANLISEKNDVN